MKKYIFCCIFLVFSLFFSACTKVIVTSADELFMTERYAETASGIKATLKFYDGVGELSVKFPEESELLTIKGMVAVDSKKFYITMQEYGVTYAFDYVVYGDKVQVSYGENSLYFYPLSHKDAPSSSDFKN